jgi:hypothetical protein
MSTNANNAATFAPPLLMLPPSPISPIFLASRPHRIIYDDDDDDDEGCRSPLFDHGYPGSPPPSELPIVGAAAHERPIPDNAQYDGAMFGGDFDSAVYSWMQLPIV